MEMTGHPETQGVPTMMEHSASRADLNERFPRFNELPKELRLAIWEAALPGPRIVYLDYHRLKQYSCHHVWSNKSIDDISECGVPAFHHCSTDMAHDQCEQGQLEAHYGFKSKSPAPNILFTCREAYEVVSRTYSLILGTEVTFPQTWFDFNKDTLYLDWGRRHEKLYNSKHFSAEDLERIRFLALHEIESWYKICSFDSHERWLAFLLADFPNLEKVTLTWHSPLHTRGDTADLVFQKVLRQGTRRYLWDYKGETGFFRISAITEENDPVLELNVEKFEEYRLGGNFPSMLSRPVIDCQMIATPMVKSKLQEAESQYVEWMKS